MASGTDEILGPELADALRTFRAARDRSDVCRAAEQVGQALLASAGVAGSPRSQGTARRCGEHCRGGCILDGRPCVPAALDDFGTPVGAILYGP